VRETVIGPTPAARATSTSVAFLVGEDLRIAVIHTTY
jgi:hypothetical protein